MILVFGIGIGIGNSIIDDFGIGNSIIEYDISSNSLLN
jgi:hypothetical protein